MECLEKVIKLSRTECACLEDDKPAEYNEGQCEVYLDELEGLTLDVLNGAANCEKGSLWDMMLRARENATLQFKADLLASLENNWVPRIPNYSGLIGETQFTSTLSFSETKAGQLVVFPRVVGGQMTIRRIGLIMNASTSIQVSVYNNDENSETPIAQYTIPVTGSALSYGDLETPLVLPLWSPNVNNLEYYFIYEVSGFMPKNNKTNCVPCSGGAKIVAWQNWVQVYGIRGNTTEYDSFNRTTELNGIVLDAALSCDAPRVICSEEYPLDFNTGRAMQIAYAIRFKAGALLIDELLSSKEINRHTMMDREALYGKRNYYRSSYEQWVKYLAENTEVINNNCWICRTNKLMSKGFIQA